MSHSDESNEEINRREFVAGTIGLGAVLILPNLELRAENPVEKQTLDFLKPQLIQAEFKINGKAYKLEIDSRETLLDVLREKLQFTGSKKGCDHGQCGACTVIVDKMRVNSCLCLAAQYQNKEITSIEGLSKGEKLHPMQDAFIRHDAFQCGFCTPGQIMSAVALLKEPCGSGDAEIRECMSGNLCRCGAYRNIVSAIQEVKGGKHAAV